MDNYDGLLRWIAEYGLSPEPAKDIIDAIDKNPVCLRHVAEIMKIVAPVASERTCDYVIAKLQSVMRVYDDD